MLTEWMSELRHAARALRRTPGFAIMTVGTLALAIGAVAGMFSVVNTVLLHPLPFPNAGRLVSLGGTAPGSDLAPRFGLGPDFLFEFKEHSKLIDGIFGFGAGTSTFRTPERVERIPMAWPTNDMYATLGVQPQLGRLPRAEDGNHVIVISDRLWRDWFGRDSSVIGKQYYASGQMRQVVGVMPADFMFPDDRTLLWVSNDLRLDQVKPGQLGYPLVARMKPGVTVAQLDEELTRLARHLPDRFGGPPSYARLIGQFRSQSVPLLDAVLGPTTQRSLWVLLGAVAIVLIIACANVANLFMVRAEGRQRDLAVRRAIGATRGQLIRLQMAEAFVVALAAGVLAVALASVTLPMFLRAAPKGIPRLALVHLDPPTFVAAFVMVVLAAIACGIVPAVRASTPQLTRLREGGRGATGKRHWARNVLVMGQTALALVMLIGAALLGRSFRALSHVNPGYDTKDLFTFQFAPDQPRLTDGPSWGRFHLAFMDRLRALPGVTSVGFVDNIPLDEGTQGTRFITDGQSAEGGGTALNATFSGGDYYTTMGIPLLAGRMFSNDEAITPNSNAIVSRSAAEAMWPRQNPIGKRLQQVGDSSWFTVVGVVGDVKQNDWREDGQRVVYLPATGPTANAWTVGSPAYVIKTSRAATIAPEVRALIREVAPEAPMYRIFTMEELARRSMVQLSFTTLTLGVVSGLALLLGAIGLYGVLSYVVAERTREIGVRMALGATAGGVRRMVVAQGARVVGSGAAIGVVVALAATRALGGLLYGVSALNWPTFAAMTVMMIGIGLVASYVPARRASSVDPIIAMRTD